MRKKHSNVNRTRRRLLGGLLAAPAALLLPWQPLLAAVAPRKLSFYHTHTGEKLSLVYHDGEKLLPDAMSEIDHYMRDFRSGDVHRMDQALLDQLYQLQQNTESQGVFEVISAYRSPKTNRQLRSKSTGVAKKSLHMQGRAIDIRLTDVPTSKLRKVALAMKSGGVGYYRKSDFLHIDTGRPRTW